SEILDDCISVAETANHGALSEVATLLTEAAMAARAAHYSAAQALTANILDTTLRHASPFGPWQSYKRLREAVAELQNNRTLFRLRTGLALAPVLLATEHFDGQANIPKFFNRHATAHGVSQIQYSRTNAIVALMAATSVLRECHELFRRRERLV